MRRRNRDAHNEGRIHGVKIGMRIIHWNATDAVSEEQRQRFREIYDAYLNAMSEFIDIEEPHEIIIYRVACEGRNSRHKCYLITLEGEPIGLAILGHWPNAFSRHDTYIQEFFILPEYQRKGYGAQAVRWIVERGPVDGDISLYIVPKNEPAKGFWSKTMGQLGYSDRLEDVGIDAKTEEGLIFRYYIAI